MGTSWMLSKSAERFRTGLLIWSEDNLRDFPWREPDSILFEVFIAEFLLTQTPAENVAEVQPEFLEQYPDIDAIEEASEEALAEMLELVGFQNRRAQALKEISAAVDSIPKTRSELLALTRVGEYIADATLCFALNHQVPILDRNIRRVYSRVFGSEWPDDTELQRDFAERMLPTGETRRYNLALLDFGADVCRHTTPRLCLDA